MAYEPTVIPPAEINERIARRQAENADIIPRIAQLTAEGQLDRAAQYQARLDVNNEAITNYTAQLNGDQPASVPPTVSPATDPQAGAGEAMATPPADAQQDGNTSGYGEQNETATPASEVRYSAKELDALAAANGVDAGNVDTEVGIVEAQLYRDEATARGQSEVSSGVRQAQAQETNQSLSQQVVNTDWRVTLRLAPNATYLYKAADAGLLQPLKVTNGVIFPYTPTIGTAYKANYDTYDLTHSNYRGYFYKNSYTDAVSLKATFTAQSTADAAYVLAVIHFFRSVTKMFYG